METNREALKILVLGAGAVGKTCLTLQFVRNEFVCGYTPTIEEVYETPAKVEEKEYLIWFRYSRDYIICGTVGNFR